MPTRASRACPGCGARLDGSAPCTPCRQQRDGWRGTPHARGYTARWARYARSWRARYPFCGQRSDGQFHSEHSQCARAGLKILAACVDHIVPISAGGSMFDPMNHQSLCNRCNTAKG